MANFGKKIYDFYATRPQEAKLWLMEECGIHNSQYSCVHEGFGFFKDDIIDILNEHDTPRIAAYRHMVSFYKFSSAEENIERIQENIESIKNNLKLLKDLDDFQERGKNTGPINIAEFSGECPLNSNKTKNDG